MSSFVAPLIIFSVAIVLMLVVSVYKPVIPIRVSGRVSFGLETFFIFPTIAAILVLAIGSIPFNEAMKGLWAFAGLNPIGIMILFFSMVYISKFLDTTGFFEFCALYSIGKSGNSGKKLFFIIYVIVSVLTIFTSNDVVVLTFTPFIHYFSRAADIDPIPFLFGEFFAANTWSMIFIISNTTNIVLGSAFKMTFGTFFKYMGPAAIVGGVVNYLIIYLYFRKSINVEFELDEDMGDPKEKIRSWLDMWVGLGFCATAIILMAVSSAPSFPFEMWQAAGILALCLLVYNIVIDLMRDVPSKLLQILETLPYPILPFSLSLFILVNSLEYTGLFTEIGKGFKSWVGVSKVLNVVVFGLFSTVSANILNNIPMSVAYVPIIQETHIGEGGFSGSRIGAVCASIVGSNLGANLTPLGALSGLMWLKILKERQIHIGFAQFMKVGCMLTPVCLIATLGTLCIVLAL